MCARASDFDTVSKLFSVIFCYYVDSVILFFHFILLFSDVWGHICPREGKVSVDENKKVKLQYLNPH